MPLILHQKPSSRIFTYLLFIIPFAILYKHAIITSFSSPSFIAATRPRHMKHTIRDTELIRRDDANGTLTQITSADSVNIAYASSDGNFYLEPQGNSSSDGIDTTTFFYALDDGYIYSDYQGRAIHIYSEEAAAYGVSRLRLHDLTALPTTSVLVTLIPIANAATGGSTLVAVTSDGQFFYLVACNIESQETKLFAVLQNPEGVTQLTSEAMQTVITGGVVDKCVLINLTNGSPGK